MNVKTFYVWYKSNDGIYTASHDEEVIATHMNNDHDEDGFIWFNDMSDGRDVMVLAVKKAAVHKVRTVE